MNKDMLRQRQALGVMGILLPIVDWISAAVFGRNGWLLPSISSTYYMNSSALFVGLVFATGIFLICYKGYDVKDATLSMAAGVGGIALVLFPCKYGDTVHNWLMLPMWFTNIVHLLGAAAFFGCLCWIMIFQFTKSATPVEKGLRKWLRNIIYIVCGCTMAGALIVGFGLSALLGIGWLVYLGETVALWAFGIGWLIKGEVLLKDK